MIASVFVNVKDATPPAAAIVMFPVSLFTYEAIFKNDNEGSHDGATWITSLVTLFGLYALVYFW